MFLYLLLLFPEKERERESRAHPHLCFPIIVGLPLSIWFRVKHSSLSSCHRSLSQAGAPLIFLTLIVFIYFWFPFASLNYLIFFICLCVLWLFPNFRGFHYAQLGFYSFFYIWPLLLLARLLLHVCIYIYNFVLILGFVYIYVCTFGYVCLYMHLFVCMNFGMHLFSCVSSRILGVFIVQLRF